MFIDSHCHLHFFDFKALALSEHDLMLEASKQQVEHILCVATHLNQYMQLQNLCNSYDNVSISIGLHPNENIASEPKVDDFLPYLTDPRVVAIGETGLDYYRAQDDITIQHQRFRTQIQVALIANKPLIIHSRDAKDDTLQILQEENAKQVGGVFHCFTGDQELAEQALAMNFCISFSGIVTFDKAQVIQSIASWVPLDRILIETDAPYLAPTPFRGKINRPAYIKYIAEHIAKLRNIELAELAFHCKQNYYRIFGN